jgi:uncharacterized protein YdgA (DUF945 family)
MITYILLFCLGCLGAAALGAIYYTTKDIEDEIKDIKSILQNRK